MEASKGKTKCTFYMFVGVFILCVFVDKLKVDIRAYKVQSQRNIWNGTRLRTAANTLHCLGS